MIDLRGFPSERYNRAIFGSDVRWAELVIAARARSAFGDTDRDLKDE